MLEDIMFKKKMNAKQLSEKSSVGYNYVYKILKNQVDFDRCGINTAKRLADALDMDLNSIYEYKCNYFQRKIYYQDQSDWNYEKYAELNAELNKLFLVGIEYHFAQKNLSRTAESSKQFDAEISCIKIDLLTDETKCIMVAILNQQKKLREFVKKYSNLSPLLDQKPLKKKLILSKEPYYIFPSYTEMNIAY